MQPLKRIAISLLLSASLLVPSAAHAQTTAEAASHPAGDDQALNAAVRDLCGKQIVMLGENGFHGDGKTNAFKVALIQRLVGTCRFNAVFFESSHYDFLAISRGFRGSEAVSPDMIASAIGGKWNQNEETAPLIPFLYAEAKAGRLALGGLDDQLGSRGSFYELDRLPAELAGHLAGARRAECQTLLRQRIWSSYPRDAPYSEASRARVQHCLLDIRSAVMAASTDDPAMRDETLQMIANFDRCIARDFINGNPRIWDRDQSLYLNLQWLAARLPARPKIIVWAANGHVANDPDASPIFTGGRNVGSYVHEAYGRRAFALGFTAASGSFRYGVRTARDIPSAPPASLEARAVAGTIGDAVYLGPGRLARLGAISGAVFDDHQYRVARWADVFDGVIVFRAERPPRRLDE